MKSTLVLCALLFVSGLQTAPRQTIVPRVINGQQLAVQHAAAVFAITKAPEEGVFGGGSIISNRHVLTGANVIFGAIEIRIGYGTTILADRVLGIANSYIIHPGFNRTTMANDIAIAIMRTADRIDFSASDAVRAIALPTSAPAPGLAGSVAGFGFTEANAESFSPVLSLCANGAPNPVMPSLISNICSGDNGAGFYTGDGFITTTTTPDPSDEDGVEQRQENDDEEVKLPYDPTIPFDPTKGRSASVSADEQVEPTLVAIASVIGNFWECNPDDPRGYTIVFNYLDWILDMTGIEV